MSPPPKWVRYDRDDPRAIWLALEDIRDIIDEMVTADEVAAKVAERLKKERVLVLGFTGKLVGIVIALGTLGTAIHSWFG